MQLSLNPNTCMLHKTKFSFETLRITNLNAQTVLKIRLCLNMNILNKYMPMMKKMHGCLSYRMLI